MKNLFFAAAVTAMAFAGCAKVETQTPGSDDLAIRFTPSILLPQTSRAVPVDGTKFQDGDKIGVYGTETIDATSTANWMNNRALTRESNGAWTYTPVEYFKKGYSYSFTAYAPYNAATTFKTATSVGYIVDADITKQVDFMYAPAVDRTYDSEAVPAAVDFTFNHALVQLKFSAKTTMDYSSYCTVTVKSVKIAGLASEGTVDFTNGTWDLTADATADYIQPVNNIALNHTSLSLLANADNHVLMVLPQTATAKTAVLTVNIVSTNGNTAIEGEKEITVTIPEKTWVRNMIYHYQATLDLDAILGWSEATFADPTITPWGSEEDIPVGN